MEKLYGQIDNFIFLVDYIFFFYKEINYYFYDKLDVKLFKNIIQIFEEEYTNIRIHNALHLK
jgi:hypothetical protein